jgi:transposase-like protein
MTRGVAHPADIRAEAVAAVLAGASMVQVARQYRVSKGTLGTWLAQDDMVRTVRTNQPTREERDDYIRTLLIDLVAEHTFTLTAELQAAARPEWLERQSAADLAQLVVAQRDTLIRLLAGLFPPAEQQHDQQLALEPPAGPSGATTG